jgi:hypothetical protein
LKSSSSIDLDWIWLPLSLGEPQATWTIICCGDAMFVGLY